MILGEQVYMVVRQELFNNSITAYSDHVPEEITYLPFVMYEITNLDPEFAFGKDYEGLTVRFNVYGNKDNPMDVITIAEQIEGLFNRKHKQFIDLTEGKKLICSYKVNDTVNYLNDPTYWIAVTDYIFYCERNIP